jgi:hypothetical protein
MATVQISFRDNADNETAFKIYKGTSAPLSASSTQIAEVNLVSGAWTVSETTSGSAPSVSLQSTNTGNSATQGETFVVRYEEGTPGDYYYGVSASNDIGDSDVVTTGSALTVS